MKIVLDKGAFMPERAHKTDAGLDLKTPVDFIIFPKDSFVVDTGIHVEIPFGYFGKIESKSGLNVKHDIVCCGGVIDEGYTGSIAVKIYNLGTTLYKFHRGDKIAQLVLIPCITPVLEEVGILEETERGADGFGSTGK